MATIDVFNFKIKKIGPITLALYLFLIGTVNYTLRIILSNTFHFSITSYYVSFVAIVSFFLVISIIVKLTVQTNFTRVFTIILKYYWLIALVPLVTYILRGEHLSEIIQDSTSFTNLNTGLLPVVFLLGLLTGYFSFNSISRKNRVIYSAIAGGSIILSSIPIFFVERVTAFSNNTYSIKLYELLDISLSKEIYNNMRVVPELHRLIFLQQSANLYFLIVFVEMFFLSMLTYFVYDRKSFISLLKNIKGFRTLHFSVMVTIGIIAVERIAPAYVLYPFHPMHFPFVALPIICMVLTWQFTAILNDYWDTEIDRIVHPDRPLVKGDIDKDLYLEIGIVLAVVSLLISLLLGFLLFVLNLSFIFAAVMYSTPPIRLKERVYSYVCVGWASVVAFLFGVYSPQNWRFVTSVGMQHIKREIPLYPDILFISVILFAVLSVSPLINALADYEGDKQAGVKSVYTVFGLDKGKKVVSILIILMFLSPALILGTITDLLVLLPIALLASVAFYKKEDHRIVFSLYLPVVIYSLLRYIHIISL